MTINRLFVLSVLALFLAACGANETPAAEANTQPTDRVPVLLSPVQRQTISDPVHLSGLVFSAQEARLSFKTGGVIEKILVDEGDAVRAGQLLAVLDVTEIDAQVNQAKQAQEKARRDLERAQNLEQEQVATREQVQNATTAFEVAEETVRIAQFNRRFSEIRAPQAGRIVSKLMNEGELAGPGTPVLYMEGQGQAAWVLRAGVADRDWARISEGDLAQISLDAYPGETLSGRVTNKSVAADPRSGSFEIELTIQPQGRSLATGMFAKASLTPKTSRELACLPASAIQEGNGRNAFVFITRDNRTAERLPVRIAFVGKDCIAIEQGLEGIEAVITAGSPFLSPGSAIEVVTTAHTQAQ